MWLRKYYVGVICLITFLFAVASFIVLKVSDGQSPNHLLSKRIVEFKIDSSFSKQEIYQIQSALIEWEVATNGYLKLTSFVDDISITELFTWRSDIYPTIYNGKSIFSWKNIFIRFSENNPKILGITFISSGDIFIVRDDYFRTVVLHELGHVFLGSWHSNVEQDLMYYNISNEKDISFLDALFVQIFTR